MGLVLAAFLRNVVLASKSLKRASSGSSGGDAGDLGKELAHLGDHAGEVGSTRPHLRTEGFAVELLQAGTERLDPGPIGRRSTRLPAVTPQRSRSARHGAIARVGAGGITCLRLDTPE